METGTPDLTVVLPTLDEGGGLRVLLPRVEALFKTLGVRGEIVVIDGGSKDDTVAVAESAGARTLRQNGRGFGSAVREGIAAASAPWVAILDADGSHAPEALVRFWARRAEADLIVGSRYCRGGSAEMPLSRQILSRSLNMVTKRFLDLPVHESSSGFRLYRAAAARAVDSAATDFSVQQDLLVGILAAGGRVVEEPIHYAPRVAGASKANAWKLLPAYVRLLLRLKKRRGGWRVESGLLVALAVGLATGLCGITGGLPGPQRLRALPEAARRSPEFARALSDQWRKLYAEIRRSHDEMRPDEPRTSVSGVVEIAAGWTFPPDALVNSARALLTQSVNPDEKKSFIILAQMRPWKLELEPLYAQYGGAFIYPLGALLGAAHILGLARLTPDLAYYLEHPESMARLYELGRLYMLLFHLGTIWLLFELGRVLSGRRTGTVAALLWALTPVAIVNSHVLKPHPVSAFYFVAAALLAVCAVDEGRGADYVLCGACAGAAAGSSLAVGFGLGLPLLARLFRRAGSWGPALWGAGAGLALTAATNPYLFFAAKDFAWELTIYAPSTFKPSAAAAAGFFGAALPGGLGLVLAPACVLGTARALFAGARRQMLAVVVLGGGLLALGRFSAFAGGASFLRLVYPLAAIAVVLAADAAAALPAPLAAALAVLAFGDVGLHGGVYLENLSRDAGPASTRALAADWIDANVPAGSSVGLLRYPEPAHTPPFRWDRVRLTVFESPKDLAAGRALPEWIVARRGAWDEIGPNFQKCYAVARDFPTERLAWAEPRDDSFFANAGMIVLRRVAQSR